MKLKYTFVLQRVGKDTIAAAVGEDAGAYPSVIRLNATGARIFALAMEGMDKEEIARALAREYGISEKEALEAADRFEERMRQAGILEEEDG